MTSVLALATFRSGAQAALMASWDVWKNTQPDIEIHGTWARSACRIPIGMAGR